jgi:hypothetical protein
VSPALLRAAFNHDGVRRLLVRLRVPLVLIALAAALPFVRADWLVRRFLPSRRPAGQPVAYWNWSLFEQNHALANLAGTLLVWALAGAWLYFN